MGSDRESVGAVSEADRERTDRSGQRWAVGGDRACDHEAGDPVLLGVGGLYDYARCRRCEAIVVSSLRR